MPQKAVILSEVEYNLIISDLSKIRDTLFKMNIQARDHDYLHSSYFSLYQDALGRVNQIEERLNATE